MRKILFYVCFYLGFCCYGAGVYSLMVELPLSEVAAGFCHAIMFFAGVVLLAVCVGAGELVAGRR